MKELGFAERSISEVSRLTEEKSEKGKSTITRTMIDICDELITGKMRIASNPDYYVCERALENGEEDYSTVKQYDVIYISRNEKVDGDLAIAGGIVRSTTSGFKGIEEYDIVKARKGTAVVGALMPIMLGGHPEFNEYYVPYMVERQKYLDSGKDGMMSKESNRDLLLMSDYLYRTIVENMLGVGHFILVTQLFEKDSVFEEKFVSMTKHPFEILQMEGDHAAEYVETERAPIIKEVELKTPTIDTSCYTEEELKLVPYLPHYVMNNDVKEVIQAIECGFRNIILSGVAGTGKSVMTQKVAEYLGMPWLQYSMTAETETIDVLGKFVPNDDLELDRKIEQENYFEDLSPEDLCYGDFNVLYERITGIKKEDASRLDVIKAIMGVCKETNEKLTERSQFKFIESNIITAMKKGYVVEIEEANLANVLSGVNSLFDEERGFCRLENGEVVQRHKNAIVIMTMNPDYEGTVKMNPAVLDRFGFKKCINELTKEEYIKRAKAKGTSLNDALLEKMTKILMNVNEYLKSQGMSEGVCGARTFFNWVKWTEIKGGDYESAMESTVLTSCSLNPEDIEEIRLRISTSI